MTDPFLSSLPPSKKVLQIPIPFWQNCQNRFTTAKERNYDPIPIE